MSGTLLSVELQRSPFKGVLCAYVIGLRVSYNQNDETLSRNSLMCSYMSRANLHAIPPTGAAYLG